MEVEVEVIDILDLNSRHVPSSVTAQLPQELFPFLDTDKQTDSFFASDSRVALLPAGCQSFKSPSSHSSTFTKLAFGL